MNLPNKLTMLRICMIPAFLVVLLLNLFAPYTRLIAVIIFILASLTDFLDGYIARSRNLVTNFGKLMDPMADKLLVASALIAMVELNDISAIVVIIIIAREFFISGFRLVAMEQNLVLAAGTGGKIKMATQIVMIVYLLLQINKLSPVFLFVGNILILLSIVLSIYSAAEYVIKNIKVIKF